MNKRLSTIILFALLVFGCQDQLEMQNPNEPSPDALNTEAGISNLATGVYTYMSFGIPTNTYDFYWVSQAAHEVMGDAIFMAFGNFGLRWANQPSSITLDNGTVIRPPEEGDQALSLKVRNAREQGDNNLFAHEWITMYFVNNASNLLLQSLEKGSVKFAGDAEVRSATLKAWAYWWKGFAYSRIGSMYVSGVISDEPGVTNSNYMGNAAILAEAEKNFQAAIAILSQIGDSEEYFTVLERVIPAHLQNGPGLGVPSPGAWIRNIHTMRARNLLVNSKDKDKSTQTWNEIRQIAEMGVRSNDFLFVMKQDGNNFISTITVPYRLAPTVGWHYSSERLVQDFKPGDQRFARNFRQRGTAVVNQRSRGIQYGTRWDLVEEGDYVSLTNLKANVYLGGTYEESRLMVAEAILNTGGNINEALQIIDEIREMQRAELPAVANTGLTLIQAKEELRRERRIGLFLRGLPFYDARRWGVIDPVAAGGGRKGAVVLDAAGNLNTNATFDYKYMDYFDVPANEIDFNAPGPGTSPVTANPK